MVTFKCHAAGTGCPLAAEQDQPSAEQVQVQQRASEAPRQLLRHPGGLLNMSGRARVTYPASLWLAVGKRNLPGMSDQQCHVRRGEDKDVGRREWGGVSAGFRCGCLTVTLCRLLPLIISSTLMLPVQSLLIIFITDLSCYKNICQNYCLACSNNSYYIIPSINYRQLHSLLFLLPLEVLLALSALTRVLSTEM